MATNRLYVVDKNSGKYCCIAKYFFRDWILGNIEKLQELLIDCDPYQTELIIGSELDDNFYEKYITHGTNVNTDGCWKYYEQS